jgi:hypothetical protein
MPRRLLALAIALLLGPALAGASAPGDPLRAARRDGELVIDGRLEEPAWDAVTPFDGFVQFFPDEGQAPSERTEVRILYDDRNLYVGVACRDRQPEAVNRTLGRRDNAPFSDQVMVFIDSMHDRRTAYGFFLNAAGVQGDGLLFGDDQENDDWDAVWEGATAATAEGWSAEFLIPLSILRFSPAASQVWGVGIKRLLARTHEELLSVPLRRGERGIVGRFANLTGLDGLEPTQDFSLAPYLAARLALRPKYDDEVRNRPRLADPTADLGLDLRASLGRGLALQGTLNPDFGQVEADQVQLNLSRFELFFPEKRPFFTQGLDLFQGPTPHNQPSPQQLFYSRRIGLDAPILGAVKLSGRASEELQIGLVESVVTGAGVPSGFSQEAPSRAFRFSPSQPLSFGPTDALPALAPAARNFVAAVARWQPSALVTLGASASSALPLGPACTTLQANTDPDDPERVRPRRCDALTGNAVAADWNLRSPGSEWFVRGQLSASQYLGGDFTPQLDPGGAPLAVPRLRRLADGTVLRPGDGGWGGFLALGRNGGEPWRFDLDLEWESPRLELNAVGYQRTQDELRVRPIVRYVRPTGGAALHSYGVLLGADLRSTADGATFTNGTAFLAFDLQLKTFHTGGCELDFDVPAYDPREIDGAGAPFQRAGSWNANCWLSTDKARPLALNLGGGGGWTTALAGVRSTHWWAVDGGLTLRSNASVQTDLLLHYELNGWPARWVEQTSGGAHLFAELHSPVASATLRQQLLLTPRLTLQAYAQLFVAAGRYGPYYQAAPRASGRLVSADLRPATVEPSSLPDFHEAALNLSAVLRWEYRLGSTLYLVYTRAATQPAWESAAAPPYTLRPSRLAHGPTTDTVLVKWSWYWAA